MKAFLNLEGANGTKNIENLVDQLVHEPEVLKQCVVQLWSMDDRLLQKISLLLCQLQILQPALLEAHYPAMLQALNTNTMSTAQKRNILRVLEKARIAPTLHDLLTQKCFEYLENKQESIAVRAYSLTILSKLADTFPEIKQELSWTIERDFEYESAAFRSRAKRILKQFNKKRAKIE